MLLRVIDMNGELKEKELNREDLVQEDLKNRISYIAGASKESNAKAILKAYCSDAKVILLDQSNKKLLDTIEALNIPPFLEKKRTETLFDTEDFSLLYFSSGSTGKPVGALKSKENIESEVKVLTKLLEKHQIKRVIVTVPFIHLYGTLFGLMYPFLNNLKVIFKEHFLPQDLLNIIEEGSMVVTTPLYLKALNKLEEKKDLSHSLFVSSTAPLDTQTASTFHQKFKSNILQVFGSTETGGIAYKFNNEELWQPFDGVKIESSKEGELRVASPFVSKLLYEGKFRATEGSLETFDYIEKVQEKFRLIGRSSKIFKLAGKRYSTVQIENILETLKGVRKALVFVELSQGTLRGEHLEITLETDEILSVKEIKKILRQQLSNLKFSIVLHLVDEIPVSLVGKKLRV